MNEFMCHPELAHEIRDLGRDIKKVRDKSQDIFSATSCVIESPSKGVSNEQALNEICKATAKTWTLLQEKLRRKKFRIIVTENQIHMSSSFSPNFKLEWKFVWEQSRRRRGDKEKFIEKKIKDEKRISTDLLLNHLIVVILKKIIRNNKIKSFRRELRLGNHLKL